MWGSKFCRKFLDKGQGVVYYSVCPSAVSPSNLPSLELWRTSKTPQIPRRGAISSFAKATEDTLADKASVDRAVWSPAWERFDMADRAVESQTEGRRFLTPYRTA